MDSTWRRGRVTFADSDGTLFEVILETNYPRPLWSDKAQVVLESFLSSQGLELVSVRRVTELAVELTKDSMEAGVQGGRDALAALKALPKIA